MRAGIVLGVLALFAYAIFGAEGLLEQYSRYRRHGALEQQLARERAVNDALRREVEGLRADDLAIERAARTELDYRRPGEVVFIVETPDPLAEAPRFDSPAGPP
jgi:cell division protein FtsB